MVAMVTVMQKGARQKRRRREHQLRLEGATEIHLSPTLEHPALTQTEPNFIKATTAALQSSSLTRQSVWKGPKMQPYNEDEDSEHSLRTFERIPSGCQ